MIPLNFGFLSTLTNALIWELQAVDTATGYGHGPSQNGMRDGIDKMVFWDMKTILDILDQAAQTT